MSQNFRMKNIESVIKKPIKTNVTNKNVKNECQELYGSYK